MPAGVASSGEKRLHVRAAASASPWQATISRSPSSEGCTNSPIPARSASEPSLTMVAATSSGVRAAAIDLLIASNRDRRRTDSSTPRGEFLVVTSSVSPPKFCKADSILLQIEMVCHGQSHLSSLAEPGRTSRSMVPAHESEEEGSGGVVRGDVRVRLRQQAFAAACGADRRRRSLALPGGSYRERLSRAGRQHRLGLALGLHRRRRASARPAGRPRRAQCGRHVHMVPRAARQPARPGKGDSQPAAAAPRAVSPVEQRRRHLTEEARPVTVRAP